MRTARLLLRPWRDGDLSQFAALNTDPDVMAFLPAALTRSESDSLASRIRGHMRRRGFGLWAVEVPGTAPFIGFTGLSVPSFKAHFTPCVEVGWRLARDYWGQGFATEAAEASLEFGFVERRLREIVSFTVPGNRRSRAVMTRLGMTRDPADDFDHPSLPVGDTLCRHLLYRLSRNGAVRALGAC